MNSRYSIYLVIILFHGVIFGITEKKSYGNSKRRQKESAALIKHNEKTATPGLGKRFAQVTFQECKNFFASFFTKNNFKYKCENRH
ncbi:hypothetical protein KC460_02255 [Candidatus Dependentiae bacterium]|nr:hypothetical protein [Candidatus Dependentiae bacterium]